MPKYWQFFFFRAINLNQFNKPKIAPFGARNKFSLLHYKNL